MIRRTRMLFGGESLVSGAGVAAFNTNDGTEIALVADSFQIKSLTARKFLDSWPMPVAKYILKSVLRRKKIPTQQSIIFLS